MNMKFAFILAAMTAMAPTAAAQLDNMSALRLSDRARHAVSRSEADSPYIPAILKIADDKNDMADSIRRLGAIIYHQRGDLLLTSIPREMIDSVMMLDGVINASAAARLVGNLDKARPMGGADAAQNGLDGLPRGYDGAGVVTGFADAGFDPSHIAFEGRVKTISDFNAWDGSVRRAVAPSEIESWTMPAPVDEGQDMTHATHVANILAGAYRGNEYYGVATGSDIAATTSRLTDVGVLCGVEDVISYAKSVGRPAVVNLSLANHLGPRDGTSLVCQYLSRCAEDAAICVSAGNSGNRSVSAFAKLAADNAEASLNVNDFATWVGFDVKGAADIWCLDGTRLEFRYEVRDNENNSIVYATPWVGGDTGVDSLELTSESDARWAEYFTGSVAARMGISPLNGRYNIAVSFDTSTSIADSRHPWARYYNEIAVRSATAAEVQFFTDGTNIFFGESGSIKPGGAGSISDMATAEGVISVGASNSRRSYPLLSGGEKTWGFDVDRAAAFSSYSDMPGIAELPCFCAPGNYVVSAVTTEFARMVGVGNMTAVAEKDGRSYYWYGICGTSMSSPFAAGVFALWLEADPTLAPADLLRIARATARTDFPDYPSPRWGAGEIDAAAGLRMVIEESTSAGEIERQKPAVEVRGKSVFVTMPPGTDSEPTLFDLSGSPRPLESPLHAGIYILHIPGFDAMKICVFY